MAFATSTDRGLLCVIGTGLVTVGVLVGGTHVAAAGRPIYRPQDYNGSACAWTTAGDVAPCIQAAINAAAPNAGEVLLPVGTWPLGKPLSLASNVELQGGDGGVTLLQPITPYISTTGDLLLTANNVSNVTVSNITFDGGGQDFGVAYIVLHVNKSANVLFDRITVQNTRGVGAAFDQGISNSGVRDSSFVDIGNHWKTTRDQDDAIQGLIFWDIAKPASFLSKGNFATNNTFADIGLDALQITAQSGFDAEANVFSLDNQESLLPNISALPAAIYVEYSKGVMIRGNVVNSSNGGGVDSIGLQNSTIRGNVFNGGGGAGIGLYPFTSGFTEQAVNDVISGNLITDNARWPGSASVGGVELEFGAPSAIRIVGNIITDNQASKTQQFGIQINHAAYPATASNVTISGNILTGNEFGPIDIQTCSGCTINQPPLATAVIAAPNPCFASAGGVCTTEVYWQSPTSQAQVWVTQAGVGNKQQFACFPSAGQTAGWIMPEHDYTFSLYNASSCDASGLISPPIATTTVLGAVPVLDASPNPCSANGSTTCTTTISWPPAANWGVGSATSQVLVSSDLNPTPTLFACQGSGGSSQATGISPGHSYTFQLFDATSCAAGDRTGVALQTVVVQGTP